MNPNKIKRTAIGILLGGWLAAPIALADHPVGVTDDPNDDRGTHLSLVRPNPSAPLAALDAATAGIVSAGPSAKVIKNLAAAGRGVRNMAGATTDVWAHEGYAYTGTFNSPGGGAPEAGVWIWDVHNHNNVEFVGIIPSPVGSRSSDVKVAAMNFGDILVHSNESCAGGPGGVEIWNIDDPANPVYLARIGPIDELNPLSDALFGGITDVGVHNLWLFTNGERDYVAVVAESIFDNFRVYDITDPTNPTLASAWGAEEVFDPGVGDETSDVGRVLNAALWLTSGFGASQNRFLHDVTISADSNRAYLSNWDAGLILLDISDPANPQYVSTALDLSADGDMEVNSNAAWPSEDGKIVVETNEDFSPFETTFTIDTGPAAGTYPSAEGSFTTPLESLPGSQMSGSATYVGLACNGDPVPTTSVGGIALIQRGACEFDEKATNAISAGYTGMVVFNEAAEGDALVTMGGDPRAIPGVFVGHSTGLAIAGAASAPDLVVGAIGETVTAVVVPNGWGQVRVWDYSDPSNPVLASSVDTVCSATVVDPSCDPAGTYSVHNVIVETTGNMVKAYVSWYSDGMLILDVTDPYNPVETARFLDNSTNDGLANDFWGVYKEPKLPWIYGSDRNGGLYVFKEYGAGSADRAEAANAGQATATISEGRGPAFVHGIVIPVDGVDYWLAGAPDGPGGAQDIPGYDWVLAGPTQLVGKHYNTGPFGAPQWWSSDAPDGERLYMVHGVIDTWSAEKAERYAARGYVHYHELVSVADSSPHPSKVVWLRHHARTSFTLDGGPRPDLAHAVTPGVDFEFINNYFVPYNP